MLLSLHTLRLAHPSHESLPGVKSSPWGMSLLFFHIPFLVENRSVHCLGEIRICVKLSLDKCVFMILKSLSVVE